MGGAVRDAVVLVDGEIGDCSEEDDGDCVVDDALPEEHCVQHWKLIGLNRQLSTLMSDMAATVSVAHSTQLTSMIYFRSIWSKRSPSTSEQKRQRLTKPMIVPTTPRKLIMPKF